MARYELSDGKSHKFWEITREGTEVTTRWGRIGTGGQTKTKSLATESAAEAEVAKLTASKTKKGYAPAGSGVTPQVAPSGARVDDQEDGSEASESGEVEVPRSARSDIDHESGESPQRELRGDERAKRAPRSTEPTKPVQARTAKPSGT
ncbi:MAG: WGR domain-containing protein, partial [Myxococcota bacterium]